MLALQAHAMAFVRKDALYHKAKQSGYRSRASFKLLELNKSYRIVRDGSKVVDLGSFPGGWSQVCLEIIGGRGRLIALDLVEMEPFRGDNYKFIRGDFRSEGMPDQCTGFLGGQADAVISDVSPKLTGIHFADYSNSVELGLATLEFAKKVLRPGGNYLVKVFPGEELKQFMAEARKCFSDVSATKPESSRSSSSEMYLVGRGMKARS